MKISPKVPRKYENYKPLLLQRGIKTLISDSPQKVYYRDENNKYYPKNVTLELDNNNAKLVHLRKQFNMQLNAKNYEGYFAGIGIDISDHSNKETIDSHINILNDLSQFFIVHALLGTRPLKDQVGVFLDAKPVIMDKDGKILKTGNSMREIITSEKEKGTLNEGIILQKFFEISKNEYSKSLLKLVEDEFK